MKEVQIVQFNAAGRTTTMQAAESAEKAVEIIRDSHSRNPDSCMYAWYGPEEELGEAVTHQAGWGNRNQPADWPWMAKRFAGNV